jgi:predicted nucleotidyltransferase
VLDYRQVHIQALSPLLEKYPQIRLGYLFGSYLCREHFRDVDIAILLDNVESQEAFFTIGCRFGEALKLGCDVDLKILNGASIEFRYTVVKNGCLFFAREEKEKIEFEIRVLDEFLDYKETLAWFDSQGGANW